MLSDSILDSIPFNLTYRVIRPDNLVRYLIVHGRTTYDEGGFAERVFGTVRDITEQKQIEEALIESEAKFRRIVETSQEGIVMCAADGKITYFNDRMCEMLKCTPDELADVSFLELVVEEWVPEFEKCIERRRRGVKETYEIPLLKMDGDIIWCMVAATPVIGADGQFDGSIAMVTDITGRKAIEESLKRSEEQFRSLFENAIDAILILDNDARFIDVNRTASELLNISRNDIVGRSLFDSIEKRDLTTTINLWTKILKQGSTEGTLSFVNDKDGSVNVEFSATGNFMQSRHLLIVWQDSIERRSLERQLQQSQKMEAVGLLAGGVAHDLNNMLTAIKGYSDLSIRRLPANDPIHYNLTEVVRASERAAALTSQLLAFGRKQILQPKVISLNHSVREMSPMLGRLIGENIEIKWQLKDKLDCVLADPVQMDQVIMNLVVNARDAMPGGGKLTISTQNVYLNEDEVKQFIVLSPGHYVRLAIADTGMGMDEETAKRIFEPFFTTKELGKGTGLGLSTVYGIVKQSGGTIWVYSKPTKGSTFEIYFPRVTEEIEDDRPKLPASTGMRGSETILLAEDEEIVRNLARFVLESHGYSVLEATNGAKALAMCAKHPGTIDLLLTDVIMPKMSGTVLGKKLTQLRPGMKIVFMSGYADEAIANYGVLTANSNFLQKPFSPNELLRKIRETLDTQP